MNKQSATVWDVFFRFAAATVTGAGLIVLGGWVFDIPLLKSLAPHWVTMKVNTAVGFIALGVSLWLARRGSRSNPQRFAGLALALFVAALGGLTLVEYGFNIDLGIDQLLIDDDPAPVRTLFPGRMAPGTAMAFLALGFSTMLLGTRRYRNSSMFQWAMLPVMVFSGLAVLGYGYGVTSLHQFGIHTAMAFHTAVLFLLAGFAVLVLRPEHGPLRVLGSSTAGGILSRQLLPFIPTTLYLIGLAALAGQERGLYDNRFAIALMVYMSILVGTTLTWRQAKVLHEIDLERMQAQADLVALNVSLEQKVKDRTRELEDALAQVRQLEGLIAICAWCKDIRDDSNSKWYPIESYITDHSEAEFTHSVCPECYEKVARGM